MNVLFYFCFVLHLFLEGEINVCKQIFITLNENYEKVLFFLNNVLFILKILQFTLEFILILILMNQLKSRLLFKSIDNFKLILSQNNNKNCYYYKLLTIGTVIITNCYQLNLLLFKIINNWNYRYYQNYSWYYYIMTLLTVRTIIITIYY